MSPPSSEFANITLGEKFVHNFLNFIGLKLEEFVGNSGERLCPRQQINLITKRSGESV